MIWRIEVATRDDFPDTTGIAVRHEIAQVGIEGIRDVRVVDVYFVEGDLDEEAAERIARELLADPVEQVYRINGHVLESVESGARVVEVAKKPGVMDPVEASALKGIADLGLPAGSLHTACRYVIFADISDEALALAAVKVLANDSIEDFFIDGEAAAKHLGQAYDFVLTTVDLAGVDDAELTRISREGTLSLNLAEMHTVRDHFASLGRAPTDCELETIAQTWSEHCVHKTFRGNIDIDGEVVENLLANTVMRATRELARPWCVSVFKDNAGIIEFDENYNLCFKVETHNHPSAIEPYGGAETGIGGVIRDILGAGLGARPVANTDVFCFAPPDMPADEVPKGALLPRKVITGVVAGVRDYGNRMGIPTVNGAVYFDRRFVGNPLVYCGTAGLIPKDKCLKAARPGDIVVVIGGRTGRDGIHGATFSSVELHEGSEVTSAGAVQIGNPITEKKVTDVLLVARDRGLYTAVTDCGAGGLSSAVGEMGEDTGARVYLERVPLKYEGLSYTEIWISEAQERMVFACPPDKVAEMLGLCESEDVEATVIGEFTDTGHLVLSYEGTQVCDIEMRFLHKGVPMPLIKAEWKPKVLAEPAIPERADYNDDLRKILGSWNVASKEWVIRQYDHEVQGASVIKPLVGVENDGPGDAAVLAPVLGSRKGIVIACGLNPCYSDIDPYHMAANAIDEALRQVVSVGGNLEHTALLDNFCWGDTGKPEVLGGFVRAAQACYDYAMAFGTPFISGKDSLNNEYATADGTISIPGCLLISAISVMDDVTRAVSMDAKAAGNLLYIVGSTKPELGGSHYYLVYGEIGARVPCVDLATAPAVMRGLSSAIHNGLVRSCHDLSEGGLAVAAAEMAFAGGLGLQLQSAAVPTTPDACSVREVLFSESATRFLVEVEPGKAKAFDQALAGVPFAEIGAVVQTPRLVIRDETGRAVIDDDISELKAAWKQPLAW